MVVGKSELTIRTADCAMLNFKQKGEFKKKKKKKQQASMLLELKRTFRFHVLVKEGINHSVN